MYMETTSIKKLVHRAAIYTLALIAIVGCDSSKDQSALLRFSTYGAVFDADGGTRSIEVVAYPKQERWSVIQNDHDDWFSYAIDGNKVVITAEPNPHKEARNAELQVISSQKHFSPYTLQVMQESAGELQFTTSATQTHHFDSAGGTYTFNVITNHEWSITTDASWLTLEQDIEGRKASIRAEENISNEALSGTVSIVVGGEQGETFNIEVTQGTRAENPYYSLCGKWEITASKWYYSPNGSLNSLDYAPNASQYYLIFDIEEDVYGESLMMRNFLYPGTALKVRYNEQSGGFTIPFGWTVLSYNVFFYVTLVSSSQFSYASLEVEVTPSANCTALTPNMPSVSGFNHIGFGLWAYNDNGNKVALGSSYRPTMFPMGNIVFRKTQP